MLHELLEAWKGHDLLGRMLADFNCMIEKTGWMFRTVSEVLVRKQQPQDVRARLYATDKEVNQAERTIRAEVVENLIARPNADVPASLILMSVVKDAERIGDYAKNLFEVAAAYDMSRDSSRYAVAFQASRQQLESLFARIGKAFLESDEAEALKIVAEAEDLARTCDEIIAELFKEELPAHSAVAYALVARYHKRIASHIRNIASAVMGTVEDLDYPLGNAHGRRKAD